MDVLREQNVNLNTDLLNCYDNVIFINDYFGDYDHIHPCTKGSQILPELIYPSFAR
jgi:hypothetical protein